MDRNKFIDDLISEGAHDEEIVDALKLAEERGEFGSVSRETPSQPSEPSLGQRIKGQWENIGEAAESDVKTPTQIEKLSSVVGRTAAFPIGAAMEVGKEVTKKLPKPPEFILGPARTLPVVGSAVRMAYPTESDKRLLGKAQEAIGKFSEKHPRAATLAETGMNLGSLIPAGAVKAGIVGAVSKKAAPLLKTTIPARIQGTKVKINSPEFKKGAQNEMYPKHEVFGSAENVRGKWQDKIDETYNQVKERIQNQPDVPENYTSIDDIFNNAEAAAEKYGKNRTDIIAEKKAIQELKKSYEDAYPEGQMSLLDAQAEKQAAGHKGDWYTVAGEVKTDPALSSTGKAYNALYDALKTTVENKGAPGIKELNKQLSEFIPMERAARKQVLVNSRKNLIPLDAFIGGIHAATSATQGNIIPALMTAATIGTRSPTVAKLTHGLGRGLEFLNKPLGKKR